jgi:hypothetical protein
MGSSRGKRSLLRRLLRAPGAALSLNTAANRGLTRISASRDATAGQARSEALDREAAIPGAGARAPAVATAIVMVALCCVASARADSVPPPATTPTSTTPDAPPPDPYKPPAPVSKPKPVTKPAVVHSTPVYRAPVRTYTPPAPSPTVRQRIVVPQHTSRQRHVKAAHRHKPRVVHRHRHVAPKPKPKPVKVTFNPFANLIAASTVLDAASGSSDRQRYLWFAGFAFAALALAGFSLQVLATRSAE